LPSNPCLKLYHDEDCEVFVNGKPVASVKGYTTSYVLVPIADKTVFRPGPNVLAAHCHQTTGGQGIDIGLVDVIDPPPRP
jgi:beta-galactosidase